MEGHLRRFACTALAVSAVACVMAAPAGAEEVVGTTCASNTATAKFSPGVEEAAKVQNISAKGTLAECTGSAGSSATYVAHLKSTGQITCASVRDETITAEGSIVIKWGRGHGNSLATVTLTGGESSGFSLTGTVSAGPFAGGTISSTLSGVADFTGKGAPCSKKNRLKTLEVTGSSPFSIS